MEVPQKLECHPEIIQFVLGSEKHRGSLRSCVPSVRLGRMGSATVSNSREFAALTRFMSEYDHVEYEFESRKINLARGLSRLHRQKLNHQSPRYEDEDIYISWSSPEKVHVSGVKTKLRGKLIELKWLVSYETINPSFTRDTYRILSLGGVFDQFKVQFGEKLLITLANNSDKLTLTGGKAELREASIFLTEKTNAITRLSLDDTALDRRKVKFLCKCMEKNTFAGRKVIEQIQRKIPQVSFRQHEESVLMVSAEKINIDSAILQLNTMVCCEKLSSQIDPEIFRSDEWKDMRERILEKYAILAIKEGGEISVTGLKEDICLCINEMEGYGMEVVTTITPEKGRLFHAQGEQFISDFSTANINVCIRDSGEVVFRGKKTAFPAAKVTFLSKLAEITVEELYVNKPAANFLATDEGRRIVERCENDFNCSIHVSCSSIQRSNEHPHVQVQQARFDPRALCECFVETGSGSKIQIQLFGRCDITTHKCDVLIHPFSETTDFESGISGAILGKAGEIIKYDLQLRQNLDVYTVFRTTSGNMDSCKHIVHFRIPSGNNNANLHDDLTDIMVNCFRDADCVEAKAIAFPVNVGTRELSLQIIGRSIAEALKQAMPLWLERVDIVALDSSSVDLINTFRREIAENTSTNHVKLQLETNRKTIILKRPKIVPMSFNFPVMVHRPNSWIQSVRQKLQKANERGHRAVEILLGPHGNSTYSARLMKSALEDFKEARPIIVQLTMINADRQTILAYEAAFCGMEGVNVDRPTHIIIGPMKLCVRVGNITEQSTHAVVVWTNDFDSDQGTLSHRMLMEAGFQVFLEFEMSPRRIVRVTNGGELPCRKIMHACVPDESKVSQTDQYREELGNTIMEILRTANDGRLLTISISPSDTGIQMLNAEDVAVEIRRAVEKFVNQSGSEQIFTNEINIIVANESIKSRILSRVVDIPYEKDSHVTQQTIREPMENNSQGIFPMILRIVLFLSTIWNSIWTFVQNSFQAAMTQAFPAEKVLISAFSRNGARRALKVLPSEIALHKKSETLRDKRIPYFQKTYCREKERIEKLCNVDITFSLFKEDEIAISGFGINPYSARREVEAILGRCLEQGETIVPWKRVSSGDTLSFSKTACIMLERAFERRLPIAHIEDCVSSYNVKYEIHLSEMYGAGWEIPTLRRTAGFLHQAGLPIAWEDMRTAPLSIPVLPGSEEFMKVLYTLNTSGARYRLIGVERIQNRSLFMEYRQRREEIARKHMLRPNVSIERLLFVGSSPESTESILKHGFTTCCRERKATPFGHGCFFSTDSKLAIEGTREAMDGTRLLYMADVLTGVFTKGSKRVRTLPKIPGTNDHYDSLVDNERNPKKFVLFHHAAAYPRYLIKYRL